MLIISNLTTTSIFFANGIKALKAEVQELKSNPALPAATSAAPLSNASASDAELKLASYQKFMEDYIVNAQTQKLMAVKEAELKAEKKFQERLEKLLATSGVALPASGDVGAPELSLYQMRNLKVAAAGEAGKSRWGSMEVQKAIENAKSQPAAVTSKQVVEESSVFDQRNARILAAAAAGKSRWGDMEVQRAKNSGITPAMSVAAAPAPANTVVTLEDRVNLGARLLGV